MSVVESASETRIRTQHTCRGFCDLVAHVDRAERESRPIAATVRLGVRSRILADRAKWCKMVAGRQAGRQAGKFERGSESIRQHTTADHVVTCRDPRPVRDSPRRLVRRRRERTRCARVPTTRFVLTLDAAVQTKRG